MNILINPFDEAEKLSRQAGKWIVGVVETRVFWPKKRQLVHFDNKGFLLMPLEHREEMRTPVLPGIALNCNTYQLTDVEARKEILRFASALSWHEGGKIEVVGWMGGGLPHSMGISRNNLVTEYIESEYLPAPANESAKAALAFYREAVSLDNPFYSFLSFYKAFSVAVPNGRERSAWLTAKRTNLDFPGAKERLAELEQAGTEVGNYLYEQCRHAVAHADREPFVNPDNTDDHLRLTKDLPLMRNFVELAIEESFEVKRKSTIYREHLYELSGFREIVPAQIIETLKRGESPGTVNIEMPDKLLMVAKRQDQRYPIEMSIAAGGWVEGGVIIDFRSASGGIELRVHIDFIKEKLHMDPVHGFRFKTGRANKEEIKEEISALEFQLCILSNGHLEIWNPETEKRLGRSETYIPMNFMVNGEHFAAEIAKLRALLEVE